VHDNLRSVGPLALIVMGVSGSGKSTFGAALASAIDCPFLEGDEFHSPEAIAKMHAGIPLTDTDRWPWLDRLGREMGVTVASHGMAVASCSALKRVYRDRLRTVIPTPTRFVLLDAGRAELLRRLTARTRHYMPPSLLTSQLDTLERPQPDEPVLTLDATRPTATLCEEVIAWLRSTAHGSAQTPTPAQPPK
jgi:gluconokinase